MIKCYIRKITFLVALIFFLKKKVPSRNLQENGMSLRKPQIDGYEMQLRKAIQNNVFGITECASQHLL